MEKFDPTWYTIPEFAHREPICMYHKEAEHPEIVPENTLEGASEASQESAPKSYRNLHVLAKTLLYCQRTGERYTVRITADDYYKLYVNGILVGQGPAPGYPEHYYYNTMDVTPYLQKGQNVIAVHLYYQGLVNRVWNSGDGRFGLACEWMDERGNRTVPAWKYQTTDAFSGGITGYDTQFLENFDSRKWDDCWNKTPTDAQDGMSARYAARGNQTEDWKDMVPYEKADYHLYRQPVEMVQVYRKEPVSVKRWENLWQLDFGKEITGTLQLRAVGKEGAKVRIRYGEECLEDGTVRYQMRCNCCYEEFWTLRQGENVSEFYDYKGFRFAQLLADEDVEILEAKAQIRHYPMEETLCTLDCSERVLSDIFEICKNGVRCGTQEGFLDCPTREKGQYLGDAVVTAHAQVWLTGDTAMLRKCIEQFAATAKICKGLLAVAPGSYMQEIADFSLLWPELVLLDYQFTGDVEFLQSCYPTARGILEHFRQYERADGLLEQVSDKWNLVDWPENLRDGYDFDLSRPVVAPGCHNVINALYIGAVGNLQKMEKILKLPCTCEYEKRKEAFIRTFFRKDVRRFRDSETSSHCSLHANVYALYYGLCPVDSTDAVADFLLEKGFSCGVFLSYFYLKGLAGVHRYEAVLQMIVNESEHGWVNMLREGATACWEAWGREQKWNTSLCHPWASGPIPVLIEDIAGLTPDPEAKGGFRFMPHIPEKMERFELQAPFGKHIFRVRKRDGKTELVCVK